MEQLIDDQSNTWKTEVIKITFIPHETEIILGIPLNSHSRSDSIIWGGTKNWVYAVTSGYHLLLNESYQNNPGSSNISKVTQVWSIIWSMWVPAKVRHFLWRACHDSLPTRKNLQHWHVLDDPRCASCNDMPESILHALWQCKSLDEIWLNVP